MKHETAKGLVLSLSILSVGLTAALVFSLVRSSSKFENLESTLADPDLRADVIEELVAQGNGIYDSFHDPMVGRVLQPNLDRQPERGDVIRSNRFGMREREYALPKPEGVTRIVLLGDSYVFGAGVDAAERVGAHLEGFLRERGIENAECLHLAVSSWNILSECAYVRRQLDSLRPDLVIQVVVNNDLDDLAGVRGFGSMSRFSPQHRDRSVGMMGRRFPASSLGFNANNFLAHGLDYESRSRYDEAAVAIGELADALERQGGRYLLALNFMGLQPVAMERLTTRLNREQWTALPRLLFRDARYRVSPTDGHWSPQGHRAVATYFYGIAEQNGLLDVAPWPEATALVAEWHRSVEEESPDPSEPPGALLDANAVAPTIDFANLEIETARQIHGGIYGGGGASPYVSMMLRNDSARRLEVTGWFLPDRALDGAVIEFFVDEVSVSKLTVEAGGELRVSAELPQELRDREYLSVRLVAEDFAYYGESLEYGIACGLKTVELVP